MKKLALLIAAAAVAAALLVPAAMAKEIASGGTPPPPPPSAAPCAIVDSLLVKGGKIGGDPGTGFDITGDYQVSNCSTATETLTLHVTFRQYSTGTVWADYDDQTATLQASKNVRGALGFYGLPGRTTFAVTVTATDASTGTVLASKTAYVATPTPKV